MKEAEIALLEGWNAIQKCLVVSQLLFWLWMKFWIGFWMQFQELVLTYKTMTPKLCYGILAPHTKLSGVPQKTLVFNKGKC